MALVIQTTLFLHEFRLWVSINPPRPPIGRVLAIGLASGVLNLVLPGRAGDLAAVGMLVRECRVRPGAAAAAVGVVAFLEAAMFGLTLVVVLALGADRWRAVVGPEKWLQALSGVSGLTLLGVFCAVVAVMVTKRFRGVQMTPSRPGPRNHPRRDSACHRQSRGTTHGCAQHRTGAVAVLEMLFAFALLFPALGLDVALPALAAAGV